MSINFKSADKATKRDIIVAIAECIKVAHSCGGILVGDFLRSVIVPLIKYQSDDKDLVANYDAKNLDLDFAGVSLSFNQISELDNFVTKLGHQLLFVRDVYAPVSIKEYYLTKFGVKVSTIWCSTERLNMFDITDLGYRNDYISLSGNVSLDSLFEQIKNKKTAVSEIYIGKTISQFTGKSRDATDDKFLSALIENMNCYFLNKGWTVSIGDKELITRDNIAEAVNRAYKQIVKRKRSNFTMVRRDLKDEIITNFRQEVNNLNGYFGSYHIPEGPINWLSICNYKVYFFNTDLLKHFKEKVKLDDFGVLGDNVAIVKCKVHDPNKYNLDIDSIHCHYSHPNSFSAHYTENGAELGQKTLEHRFTILPRFREKLLIKDSAVEKLNKYKGWTAEYNGLSIKLPADEEKIRDFLNGKTDSKVETVREVEVIENYEQPKLETSISDKKEDTSQSTKNKEVLESVTNLLTDLIRLKELLEKLL